MSTTDTLSNPYLGLRSFPAESKDLFFGRDDIAEDIIHSLKQKKLLILASPAGTGKTSLINCKIIPEIEADDKGKMGKNYRVTRMRPGSNPIHNLTLALTKPNALYVDFTANSERINTIEEDLKNSTEGLERVFNQVDHPGLVIVIDQGEELFENIETDEGNRIANHFMNLLIAATQNTEIYILFAIRHKALQKLNGLSSFPDIIGNSKHSFPLIKEEGLKQIIHQPLINKPFKISQNLEQRLLDDVRNSEDQLPVLQHALQQIYEEAVSVRNTSQNSGRIFQIGEDIYDKVKESSNTIDKQGEDIIQHLTSSWNSGLRLTAKKVFQALTTMMKDGSVEQRFIPFKTLFEEVGEDENDVLKVINAFRHPKVSFIVSASNKFIKHNTRLGLSQEAIASRWSILREWAAEEARAREFFLQLSKEAQKTELLKEGTFISMGLLNNNLNNRWEELHLLLRNPAWGRRYNIDYEASSQYLLDSVHTVDLRIQRENKRIEEEEKREKRRSNILKLSAGIGILALFVSIFFFVNAIQFRREALNTKAEGEQYIETGRSASGKALSEKEDLKRKLQLLAEQELALEGQKQKRREALRDLDNRRVKLKKQTNHAINAEKIAKKEKENSIIEQRNYNKASQSLIIETDKAKASKKEAEREALVALRLKKTASAHSIALRSLDMKKGDLKGKIALAAFDFDKKNRIPRDIITQKNITNILQARITNKSIIYRALSSSYTLLDNKVRPDKFQPQPNAGAIKDIHFDKDGNRFYSVTSSGELLTFEPNRWLFLGAPIMSSPKRTPISNSSALNVVTISGQYIGMAGQNCHFMLRNTNSYFELKVHDGYEVTDIQPLGQQGKFVSIGKDKTVRITSLPSKNVYQVYPNPKKLRRAKGDITALATTPDGKFIAWVEGTQMMIYDMEKKELKEDAYRLPKNAFATKIRFNHRSNQLAVGYQIKGNDAGRLNIYTFNKENIKLSVKYENLLQHQARIMNIVWSDSDDMLATSSADKTTNVWLMNNFQAPGFIPPPLKMIHPNSWAMSIGFSAKSNQLVVGYRNGEVRFWSLESSKYANAIFSSVKKKCLTKEEWKLHIGESHDGFNDQRCEKK